MAQFTIDEMMEMQRKLADHYQNPNETPAPELGPKKTLWMVGEVGEVIDDQKKHGFKAIMQGGKVRAHFVEEMADVLMYYNEILMCYGISSDELRNAYIEKFEYNMKRW